MQLYQSDLSYHCPISEPWQKCTLLPPSFSSHSSMFLMSPLHFQRSKTLFFQSPGPNSIGTSSAHSSVCISYSEATSLLVNPVCLGTFLGMEAGWHGKACFTAGFLSGMAACKLLLGDGPRDVRTNHGENPPGTKLPGPAQRHTGGVLTEPQSLALSVLPDTAVWSSAGVPKATPTSACPEDAGLRLRLSPLQSAGGDFTSPEHTFVCTGAVDKGAFKGAQRGNHLKAELRWSREQLWGRLGWDPRETELWGGERVPVLIPTEGLRGMRWEDSQKPSAQPFPQRGWGVFPTNCAQVCQAQWRELCTGTPVARTTTEFCIVFDPQAGPNWHPACGWHSCHWGVTLCP